MDCLGVNDLIGGGTDVRQTAEMIGNQNKKLQIKNENKEKEADTEPVEEEDNPGDKTIMQDIFNETNNNAEEEEPEEEQLQILDALQTPTPSSKDFKSIAVSQMQAALS